MRISGLVSALATPVTAGGAVDFDTLDRLCDFLIDRGARAVCVGGATSEYPRFESGERLAILRRVVERVPQGTTVVAAIGTGSLARTTDLGRAAFDLGVAAVLLPMPWFFPYSQEDLAEYAAAAADAIAGPTLLYDLPGFTTGLEPETVVGLLRDHDHLVGIKDSSGRLDRLAALVAARGPADWTLLVGDDRCGLAAAQSGWDGAISGLAGCCPELMMALHAAIADGDVESARRFQRLVDQLIERLMTLPTPWGVKVALRARGLDTGPLPLPLSATRAAEASAIAAWLPAWLAAAGIPHLLPVRHSAA